MENAAGAFWSGGAYVLTMLLLYLMPVGYFFAYGMGSLAAFGAMCRAERKNYRQKAFLSLTFFTLHWLAITTTDILYDNIYNFAGQTDFMVAHPELWYVLFLGMCVIYRGMEFALLAFEIWCILKASAHDGGSLCYGMGRGRDYEVLSRLLYYTDRGNFRQL